MYIGTLLLYKKYMFMLLLIMSLKNTNSVSSALYKLAGPSDNLDNYMIWNMMNSGNALLVSTQVQRCMHG